MRRPRGRRGHEPKTEAARPFAFEQRGYEAIGGEVFLLALPLVWFGIESMIRDMVTMARELWRGGGHE